MNITVITPETLLKNETEIVNELFRNGLQRLHVRKPENDIDDNRRYIESIETRYHPRIIIAGSYDLYNEYELGGIHLNSNARRDEALRKKLGHLPPGIFSTSYHTWQKIIENEFEFGSVFISPVFDSISKKEYKANIDPAGAQTTKQKLAAQNGYCPAIIGLGGVGLKEIEPMYHFGFDGAALLGSLWRSGNPVATFTKALDIAMSFHGQDA